MWKKEDGKVQGTPETSAGPTGSGTSQPGGASRDSGSHLPVSSSAAACISQGIRIKGEVSGSEDLFVDGTIDGKLDMGNASVTVGPNGTVKADILAREVIVRGRVDGKITGHEKVQLWSTGRVSGEVQTVRLAIEEGATLRGKVEAGKAPARSESRSQAASGESKIAAVKPAAADAATV